MLLSKKISKKYSKQQIFVNLLLANTQNYEQKRASQAKQTLQNY